MLYWSFVILMFLFLCLGSLRLSLISLRISPALLPYIRRHIASVDRSFAYFPSSPPCASHWKFLPLVASVRESPEVKFALFASEQSAFFAPCLVSRGRPCTMADFGGANTNLDYDEEDREQDKLSDVTVDSQDPLRARSRLGAVEPHNAPEAAEKRPPHGMDADDHSLRSVKSAVVAPSAVAHSSIQAPPASDALLELLAQAISGFSLRVKVLWTSVQSRPPALMCALAP